MIRNNAKLRKFYRKIIREERFSYAAALSIYESLHNEAVSLGVINSGNIMEGLEVDKRIAAAVNGVI